MEENIDFSVMMSEAGIKKCKKIGKLFDEFFKDLSKIMGEGKEHNLVLHKLEEACFFAKKSMEYWEDNRG